MATTKLMTADELLHLPDDGWRYELIEGVLIRMGPAYGLHGELESDINALIWVFVRQHRLGRVYSGETGFFFGRSPDTILCPDVSFVRRDRLPALAERARHFMTVVPDLAVEVRSPSESMRELSEKVRRYIEGGVALVWVVEPDRRAVTVYEAGQPPVEVGEYDTLDGGDVLPSFRLPLSELWEAE